jgi:hypothetical protein
MIIVTTGHTFILGNMSLVLGLLVDLRHRILYVLREHDLTIDMILTRIVSRIDGLPKVLKLIESFSSLGRREL